MDSVLEGDAKMSEQSSLPHLDQIQSPGHDTATEEQVSLEIFVMRSDEVLKANTRQSQTLNVSKLSAESLAKLVEAFGELDAGNLLLSRRLTHQLKTLIINVPVQRQKYGSFKPDGDKDGQRRSQVARVLSHLSTDSAALGEDKEDMVDEALNDIGWAYNKRHQADGLFMVTALYLRNLTTLKVDLGPNCSDDGSYFSDLLFKLFKADDATSQQTWPNLETIDITVHGDEAEIVIPCSVKELILRNLHEPLPRLRVAARSQKVRLRRITLEADFMFEYLPPMVTKLLEDGRISKLSYVKIAAATLDTATVVSMFDAFRKYVSNSLQEVIVDLKHREDDPENLSGENDHIESIQALPCDIFDGIAALKRIHISRFLLPRYANEDPISPVKALKPYLKGNLHIIEVMGAFWEEFEDAQTLLDDFQALEQEPVKAQHVCFGIDFNVGNTWDLNELATPILPALNEVIKRNRNCANRYAFRFRSVGDEQHGILDYRAP